MLLVGGWLWWPGDLWLKSADGIAARMTAGSVALHWGSIDGACCSVKLDEAGEWVDPAGSHLSLSRPAPVAGYIVTYRTCCANTRTALLELYVLIGLRHLDNSLYWTELSRLVNCLEANPIVNTAHNTQIVVIVGYIGNPLYRAVAWIPICISITWSSKFLTCGRLPQW
jgi:hypothetical protein